MPLDPFKNNKNPIYKFFICLVFPTLVMFYFISIGALVLINNLEQDHYPNVGLLPLKLVNEYDYKNGVITAIVRDRSNLVVVTDKFIEMLDGQFDSIWRKEITEFSEFTSKPVIDDQNVYYSNTKSIIALKKSTSETIWSSEHPDEIIEKPKILGISNGMVYFEFFNYGLYAFNSKTGKLAWDSHCFKCSADIGFFKDRIIIKPGYMIQIRNAVDGKAIDEIDTGVIHGMIVDNGILYFADSTDPDQYTLKTYNLETSEKRTIFSYSDEIRFVTVYEGNLYISTEKEVLKVFPAGTDVAFWHKSSGVDPFTSMFASKNLVLVLDNRGLFTGFQANDGRKIGSFNNYWLSDPDMVSVKITEEGKFDIILANSRKIFHFVEIGQ